MKKLLFLIIAYILLIMLLITMLGCVLRRSVQTKIKQQVPKTGISILESVTIGGIKQWILVQGCDLNKPILLMLHGNYAIPIPYGIGFRSVDKELIDNFILVYWDQRGAGKSYDRKIDKETINMQQFLSDANELVDYLRNKYKKEKIFIGGHSLGAMVSLQLAAEHPEKFYAYIGVSLMANGIKNDRKLYKWVLNYAKNKSYLVLQRIYKLGRPPYTQNLAHWLTWRIWLIRYGGLLFFSKETNLLSYSWMLKSVLFSPDYSFLDLLKISRGTQLHLKTEWLITDYYNTDYFESIAKINVPVYFFHGIYDKIVSSELLGEYFDILVAAKGKKLIWLDKSAHIISKVDTDRMNKILVNEVLNKCYK